MGKGPDFARKKGPDFTMEKCTDFTMEKGPTAKITQWGKVQISR